MKSFGFIGGGRITHLLLKRLHERNALPQTIIVSDLNSENLSKIQAIANDKIQTTHKNVNATEAEVIFLAVHPPAFSDVANDIKNVLKKESTIVSLIPVITFKKMEKAFAGKYKIVRMIPNAPSIIGKGYNPITFSQNILKDKKEELLSLFNHWGETPEVAEDKLEAYAILTGMGPTYFWFQWLELIQLGKEFGLNEIELAKALPAMLHGATDSLFISGMESEKVTDLIPVYPIKDGEEIITTIFHEKLGGLFKKLTTAKNN